MQKLTLFVTTFAIAILPQLSFAICEQKNNSVTYTIEAELHTDVEQISGHEMIQFTNHTCKNLDKLYLHVYPNAFRWEMDGTYAQEAIKTENPENHFLKYGKGSWLKIHSMQKMNGEKIFFSMEKELLTATLPHALAPEESIEIEVSFTTQMAPLAERSGVWNGNYAVSQWFPKMMVYDSKGWALEHNAGYHFTGEFYGDFGSYNVSITAPKKMVVGATGHKVAEQILPDHLRKKSVFHAENVHDFAWVADQNFIERTILVGKTRIHVLTRHQQTQVIGDYAESAFEYFSKRIGEYPYEDFTVAETYYNGPMEFPQLIFIKSYPASFSRWFERDATRLLETATVHETAHQWFYGVVGNNEVVNAWMDEGFATYFEIAYMRDTYGREENLMKFTNQFQLTDNQLAKIIWRLEEPDLREPIQTPSYKFADPSHYYASVYYKMEMLFRQMEALLGREKIDRLLQSYYKKYRFKNAEPTDWYKLVREQLGEEVEFWFHHWIETVARSDYAISSIETAALPDGTFKNTFTVSQKGDHFVPVDVELVDEKGVRYRARAALSRTQKEVNMEMTTLAKLTSAEVDPDHVAPDVNRFNNIPSGIFPSIKIWPFSTKTIPSSAVGLFPFPSIAKRPGIGFETGFYLGITHYLDWLGDITIARDWRHKEWDINANIETLEPNSSWGWLVNYQRDVLQDEGMIMIKHTYGPEVRHDPSQSLQLGAVYFGDLGDNRSAAGVGSSYTYSNRDNGKRFRYSANVTNSVAKDLANFTIFDRMSFDLHTNITLEHWIKFDARGFYGKTHGEAGKSALFDLQADDEGAMRFDDKNIKQYKFNRITAGNFELQFPMPYGNYVDSLGIIHGPSWEWHLFTDISSNSQHTSNFLDAGIGTRFYIINENFGRLGFKVDLVPYQNVLGTGKGFSSPVVIFNMISTR